MLVSYAIQPIRSLGFDQRRHRSDAYAPWPVSAPMRACLLATSAGQRARLMLPTGPLSGVEFPVTSKYVALLACAESCDFGTRVSRATVWKGACASFHSTLAFSIQKLASRRLPQ